MKNLLFPVPLLLLLSVCKPAAPSTENSTMPASSTATQPASNTDLLIGKWQSTDDPESIVEFDGKQKKDRYAGDLTSSGAYTVGDNCTNPSDAGKGTPSGGDYISVAEDDMCWEINNLNADFLSLSYVARGNNLQYNRMK